MVVGAQLTVPPEKVQELATETPLPSASSSYLKEDEGAAAVADILGEDGALSDVGPSPRKEAALSEPSQSPSSKRKVLEELPTRLEGTGHSPLRQVTPTMDGENTAIATCKEASPALLEDDADHGTVPISPLSPSEVLLPVVSVDSYVPEDSTAVAVESPIGPSPSLECRTSRMIGPECVQNLSQDEQGVLAPAEERRAQDVLAPSSPVLAPAEDPAETQETERAQPSKSKGRPRLPNDLSASEVIAVETDRAQPSQAPATSSSSGGYGGAGGEKDVDATPARTGKSITTTKMQTIGPPESVEPSTIYKLYRGTTCQIKDDHVRTWVEFPALQLCWAEHDLPARPYNRVSLLDLTSCQVEVFEQPEQWTRVEIYADDSSGTGPVGEDERQSSLARQPPMLTFKGIASKDALQEFGEALQQLIQSRETEGQRGLEFIQKRLFQYLWKHQGGGSSKHAQAVLAFNIQPKEGVAYLRDPTRGLNKRTEQEIGEWIALMALQKGGLDPTMLGEYFSRRDTLEIFRVFVRCLDFRGSDIVVALRKLFDTFKPGGEGQVITRILEYFAEAYFDQWKSSQDDQETVVAYANPDSVLQVAVSLIMLNTGLHVASKKAGKKAQQGAAMTVEQYISNTRGVLTEAEVPDQALCSWYEAVRVTEISVEPLPKRDFSKLPVQPQIEGWLIAVLGSQNLRRFWAVLALQRLYLFSDTCEMEPGDVIDVKDVTVLTVSENGPSKDRFASDLQRSRRGHLCQCFSSRDRAGIGDLEDSAMRAFEVSHAGKPTILQKSSKPRTHLALVAESPDLMEKWVNLIAAGPY